MKTSLNYRTFDELVAEVSTDFHVYNKEGLIEPAQLIKVVQDVNYDLGLRITTTREAMLDIFNGKAKLPNNFFAMEMALFCRHYKVIQPFVDAGTLREDVILNDDETCCKVCAEDKSCCRCVNTFQVCIEDGGTKRVAVIEKSRTISREYDEFEPLYFKPSVYLSPGVCESWRRGQSHNAEIKDGYIFTQKEFGKVYIMYYSNMEDDEGNLLVLDHPSINQYYEYALKHRILENLYFNGEDVERKMDRMEVKLKNARRQARSIVDMPNFQEMQETWQKNRRVHYNRYYEIFASNYYNYLR